MKKTAKDHEGTLFGSIIKSMIDVEIPDFPRDENGNITDSAFQYHFYKKHYFDFIDFTEEGLVRSPIYEPKLTYFFEKMVVPSPDSLIVDAHKVIELSYNEGYLKGDTLIYQFTLSHLLNYFEESKIMGYDAVFVAIAEDWYLSGLAPWADTAFMSKLKERVEKITPTRLGSTAFNLVKMQSFDDKYYTLHDVKADYTVLIFWEPSCGHCKKEVPKLLTEFNDTLKDLGVKVFAIYTQYDKKEWSDFIVDKGLNVNGWINVWDGPYPHSKFRDYYDIYSTPVIYVLDKNKKIVGKRLNTENIKDLIMYEKKKEEYEKNHN
ncbi:MAG: redoxin domain-containing protein [Bacteroidales bacterium]|nr:redoxin domain-containing protein [Bacteroidales bacterium]